MISASMQQVGQQDRRPILEETFRKVERAKQEWEATMDALPELVCVVDVHGRVIRANRTLERWNLGRVQAVPGQDVHSVFHPDCSHTSCELDRFLNRTNSAAAQGEVTQFEGYDAFLERYLVIWRRPVSPQSRLAAETTAIIVQDVTQQRLQEAALQESQERYHKLITNASFGVAIFGTGGEIRIMNPAFRDLLKIEQEPAAGPLCVFTVPNLVESGLAGDIRSCLHAAERTIVERPVMVDGASIFLRANLVPLHDAQGTIAGVQILAEDITELKRTENQRNQARKLEAVGALAAGIAHEINTPVQFIGDNLHFLSGVFQDLRRLLEQYQALSEQVQHAGLPLSILEEAGAVADDIDLDYLLAEAPDAIAQAEEGVSRVASIVKAMHAFAHPVDTNRRAADLNQAIENTLIIAHSAYKKVADVALELDPDLPMVPCDLGEINQVLLNLVVNAAHAIKAKLDQSPAPARGRITIKSRRIEDDIAISVADTGLGIPREIHDRIFDPFFTTKPVGEGTGQGLSIAHAIIVQKHHGQLYFSTEVGQGTVFTIRLPLEVVKPGAQHTGRRTQDHGGGDGHRTGQGRTQLEREELPPDRVTV